MSRGFFGLPPPSRPSNPVDFSTALDSSSLKGKNVLITGGATGIGQACVVAFANAGAYVTIADVNEEAAQETAQDLSQKGFKVQFVKTDVTDWAAQVAAFKSAIAFGPNQTLDIVVPAAGIGGGAVKPWLDAAELDDNGDPKPVPRKVMDVNLDAVYATTHLALFYFQKFPGRKEDDKQIVFVASMGGYSSMTGVAGYCTAKWGVRGLFRSLRGAQHLLGEDKPVLRCNLIAPGWIKTPMTKRMWESGTQMKFATPEEVATVVLKLTANSDAIGKMN
jgi:5'-hydroxyaverantin dehydrogenase